VIQPAHTREFEPPEVGAFARPRFRFPRPCRLTRLEAIASWYRQQRFEATVQPSRLRRVFEVEGVDYYPDIAITDEKVPVRFISFETRDTLGPAAMERWRALRCPYAQHCLYVPQGLYSEAWSLAVQASVRTKVIEYVE
jgi:hypothetical protein